MLFERKTYLQKLIKAQGNRMIKIVTGIRRCGKSFLLFHIFRQYLMNQGVLPNHFIGLELDDRKNRKLLDPDNLLEYINNHLVHDGKTNYVILDEVQLVDDFVSVLLSLTHMDDVETFVSGSNSKFLSSDVVTEFRGRGWEIRLHPLSFSEYYEAVGGSEEKALAQYYRFGGLPGVINEEDEEGKSAYLQSIYETTYLRDVIERNHLRNEETMNKLVRVLASDIGASSNPSRIARTFKSQEQISVDPSTIADYIRCLKDAFIIDEALRYNVKGRKYIGTETKYFFEDLGVRNILINFRQEEHNHLMENAIYNELKARGCAVDVGLVEVWEQDSNGTTVRKNLEVDFVVNRMPKRVYIQSAYDLPTREKTLQEQRPLTSISDNFRKVIIIGRQCHPWINDEGVNIVSIYDFLLRKDDILT